MTEAKLIGDLKELNSTIGDLYNILGAAK